MLRPDATPVSLTPEAIQTTITHCLHVKEFDGSEACGLVFGKDGVGQRVVGIRNVHPDPVRHFLMSDDGLIEAMKEADVRQEDLIAVYHSHPTSDPIPSENDRSTNHVGPGSPVYLIIGLEEVGHPLLTAWRIDLPFIGAPRATQVAVHSAIDGQPYIANPPLVPWALSAGNKVALTYQRPGHPKPRTIITEIIDVSPDPAGVPGKATLILKSAVGTDPKVMLVERVKAARVLREAPVAGRVRQRVAAYGRSLATIAEGSGFDDIAKYSAFISAAFPGWLRHIEGE